MAEDAIRDDYEDKYLGGGEDDVTERLLRLMMRPLNSVLRPS